MSRLEYIRNKIASGKQLTKAEGKEAKTLVAEALNLIQEVNMAMPVEAMVELDEFTFCFADVIDSQLTEGI